MNPKRMRVRPGRYGAPQVECPKCGIVGSFWTISRANDAARKHAKVPHEGIAAFIERGAFGAW